MPPSKDPDNDAPKTPARKVSTTSMLSGAWERLTRSRSGTGPLPAPTTVQTPVEAVFARAVRAREDLNLVGTASGNGSSNGADGDGAAQLVTGGPQGLQQLLMQAQPGRPLNERIAAVRSIAKINREYPLRGLLAVWETAEDLLSVQKPEAVAAGFDLLNSCVAARDLTPVERKTFFDAIRRTRDEGHLSGRFDALFTLTRAGKDIEGFGTELPDLMCKLLEASYEAVHAIRKKSKKPKSAKQGPEEVLLPAVLRFIGDVAKYNSKSLTDKDIENLLTRTVSICERTTSEDDFYGSLVLIETFITYTNMSAVAVKACVELLADMFQQLDRMRKQAWHILKAIFSSHLGQTAVTGLLAALKGSHTGEFRATRVRGAFKILTKLIRRVDKPGTPAVSFELFIQACSGSLQVKRTEYRVELIGFFSDLLASDGLATTVLKEAELSSLMQLILEAGEAPGAVRTGLSNLDSPPVEPATSPDPSDPKLKERALALRNALVVFAEKLAGVFDHMDLVQRATTIDCFLNLGLILTKGPLEAILDYYNEQNWLWLSDTGWLEACRFFSQSLLKERSYPTDIRIRLILTLVEVYGTAFYIDTGDQVGSLVLLILEGLSNEDDVEVLTTLASFALQVVEHNDVDLSLEVISLLRKTILGRSDASPGDHSVVPDPQSPSLVLTDILVRLFLRTLHKSASKAVALLEALLEVARSKECAVDARIAALKLLCRLRSDTNNRIYVVAQPEGEEMAAILGRTAQTLSSNSRSGTLSARPSKLEPQSSSSDQRIASGLSSSSTLVQTGDGSANSQPLWFYPGAAGLPEAPDEASSYFLVSATPKNDDKLDSRRTVLKMGDWLDVVMSILKGDVDWDTYSYCVIHLGPQLVNDTLFAEAIPQIRLLRTMLCDQFKSASYQEPPSYTSLRKSDVAVCLYYILTMLISYHDHFSKNDEDEMVRAFLLGIGTGEATSTWCIHALSVACHEMGPSVSKSLEQVLHKMSQIITQTKVQMHVLEFIGGLCRMPELYKNFREDDFRLVFGVCFRFLQKAREERDKRKTTSPQPVKTTQGTLRHTSGSRDLNAMSEAASKFAVQATTNDLPQYVYALAHHVLCFWFLALKLEDRPRYLGWITKNLTYTEGSGASERPVVEEQGVVTIDMMQRVAYTDQDLTERREDFVKPVDGEVSRKSWVMGTSILTIETAGRTGVSQITSRRPSATKYSIFQPEMSKKSLPQSGPMSGITQPQHLHENYIGVLPDHIFQEIYSPFGNAALPYNASEQPIPLPDDDTTRRALSTFDRNTTVDSHKVGVLYIGEGQTAEADIFANVMGSQDYTQFVTHLGTLTRLKGATFNTQGLDRESDLDGQFTVAWRDRVAELVFHVATMMPTDRKHDPQGTNKKKHTGNDYVNIVWNNSGAPFDFNTFPSAFNYVYIVITPTARASFLDTRTTLVEHGDADIADTKSVASSAAISTGDTGKAPLRGAQSSGREDSASNRYYRVHVHLAPGFPAISPASSPKLVSAKALPDFVRVLALNASVFSLEWANREGGEHISSWRNRLREIYRLRDKYGPSRPTSPDSARGSAPTSRPPSTPVAGGIEGRGSGIIISGMMGMGGDRRTAPPQQQAARESGAGFKRASAYTVMSEDNTSRSSLLSNTGDAAGDK